MVRGLPESLSPHSVATAELIQRLNARRRSTVTLIPRRTNARKRAAMAGEPNRAEAATSAALGRDARILRRALLEAVGTSPDSFFRTREEVAAQSHDYWVNEIRSSTWVVAQCSREIVGVAAGKLPDSDADREDQAFTRYIESVWIEPAFRRNVLGTRLIHYLLEMDYRKNQQIRQFLSWVLDTNSRQDDVRAHGLPATPEAKLLQRRGHSRVEVEVKYRLDFDAAVHMAHEDSRQ
jgi:GNAT superfamily N-acetyltransferase